ncbi:Dyp-type peroxidase [Pluteus cervinus]|uniref:Dyp-type peroxidase n=1 Tax=Pluteus cervinus TaxID=181527 RepID=A0ACD3AFK0_9AGAR|nr:Dyp-type peroxidase [Pluteus cervinus]
MRVLPLLAESTLNLDNIQGDILSGLPKKALTNYYFKITDAAVFKKDMKAFIPQITTTTKAKQHRETIEGFKIQRKIRLFESHSDLGPALAINVGVNIGFSKSGHAALGIDIGSHNKSFALGQADDAIGKGTHDGEGLNDPEISGGGKPDWDKEFLEPIHGFFLIAGDSDTSIKTKIGEIETAFKDSISKVHSVSGKGLHDKKEHFGFRDDISNPAIEGFHQVTTTYPKAVKPGVILLGHPGDPNVSQHQGWIKDGSFLVFRYLHQKVPEFNKFLIDNAINAQAEGSSVQDSIDLLGARMFGRWKSGTPIDVVPFVKNDEVAHNPDRVNSFRFSDEREIQKLCPMAAHIRKTMPRDDRSDEIVDRSRIMRRGIPFGDPVTHTELSSEKSDPQKPRGLIFHCYQSSIEWGFRFIQITWANNPRFPLRDGEERETLPGIDPIIGQRKVVEERKMSGLNPHNAKVELKFPDPFVVPRGGEYFFVPSIQGLKEKYAVA